MKRQPGKKLFKGLDSQFILYFMLFAYVPLLVFSVLGYMLNRHLAYHMSLKNLNREAALTSERLQDFFKDKEDAVMQTRSWAAFLSEPAANTAEQNFSRAVSNSSFFCSALLVKPQKIIVIKNVSDSLLREIKDQITASAAFVVDAPGRQYFMRYPLTKDVYLLAAVPFAALKNKLPVSDLERSFSLYRRYGRINLHRGYWASWNEGKKFIEQQIPVGSDWVLKARISNASVYSALTEFLKEILLANLIIGFFLLIIAVLLSRRITGPIRALVLAANKISRGDLSQPVSIEAKNEIHLLATEFETMRSKLLESYSNLENKIEERTEALREAQFQISHQEKMASLGLLAAGVAHEIGNPLTSISSMAQIIKRKVSEEPIQNYLNTISNNIERISKIVRELVDFARPSNYETAFVDVNEIIRNAVSIVKYDRRTKNIALHYELAPDLPNLFLVSDQLLQVFLNILLNAVDALKEDRGEITIRSQVKNGTVRISFKDNGSGIPQENLNKIFEPFFTTKKVGKGTGLGLSVSYGIIKSLNGKIDVESVQNRGTTFIIIIPVTKPEAGA